MTDHSADCCVELGFCDICEKALEELRRRMTEDPVYCCAICRSKEQYE